MKPLQIGLMVVEVLKSEPDFSYFVHCRENVEGPSPYCWQYLGQLTDAGVFLPDLILRNWCAIRHDGDLALPGYSIQQDVAAYPTRSSGVLS
jgi:hypothetical protein